MDVSASNEHGANQWDAYLRLMAFSRQAQIINSAPGRLSGGGYVTFSGLDVSLVVVVFGSESCQVSSIRAVVLAVGHAAPAPPDPVPGGGQKMDGWLGWLAG